MRSLRKVVERQARPIWVAALATSVWANRHDVRRWTGFAQRAFSERRTRPLSEVLVEARVRASVSADKTMRRDPSLKDIAVADGVITLTTTAVPWGASAPQVLRLNRVKGISEVKLASPRAVTSAPPATCQNPSCDDDL